MRRLAELLQECGLHLQALREAMGRCPQPLTEAHFARRQPELIAALDQFAYRFTKLQDVMSAKLFRQYALEVLHEPVESAPIIDILNLLERYGRLLAKRANRVTGIERSAAMVARVQPSPGFRCLAGDIRTVQMGRTFDAVL